MANTTWSATDKTAGVTLSGSNLTAALNAASTAQGVRATDNQYVGQFYFEVTATTWTGGAQPIVGIANKKAVLTSVGATPLNAAGVVQTGSIYVNNSSSISLGARANGDIIGIAVDLTQRLIWFRVSPAGTWNANAGFAPGGTGGLDISAILGGGFPAFPIVACTFTTPSFTANFGDTAFSGAVPSGYTTGWPTATAIPTNTLATQVAAEHWLTTNPNAQITQVALEHWASVVGVSQQAVVTQVALEHWASVANVPAFVNGPIITMIGSP